LLLDSPFFLVLGGNLDRGFDRGFYKKKPLLKKAILN